MSEDPAGGHVMAPQTLNRYTYCWNRPTVLVDADGRIPTAGISNAFGPYGPEQTYSSDSGALTAGIINDISDDMLGGTSCDMDSGGITAGEEPDTWDVVSDYLTRSGNQVLKGNFADDVTLLGTTGEILLGLTGVDVLCDIRDLASDIDALFIHTDREVSGLQVVLDVVAFLPVVGSLKYSDEVYTLVKRTDPSEKNSAMQDSPPAAGCASNIIPIRHSAIPPGGFYLIGNQCLHTII